MAHGGDIIIQSGVVPARHSHLSCMSCCGVACEWYKDPSAAVPQSMDEGVVIGVLLRGRCGMHVALARARSARGGSYESQSSLVSQEGEYTHVLGCF